MQNLFVFKVKKDLEAVSFFICLRLPVQPGVWLEEMPLNNSRSKFKETIMNASTFIYDFCNQDHLIYITSSDSVGGRSIWLEVVGVGVVLTHPPSSRRRSRSSQLRPPAILPP
jgi:hypothetical protein